MRSSPFKGAHGTGEMGGAGRSVPAHSISQRRARSDAFCHLQGGFTLLEVILAVAIGTGILIAMLLFYRQTADLRAQLLLEADRIGTIRLLLDRITTDLRTARSDYESLQGLTGDATSLQLVRVEVPPVAAWGPAKPGRGLGVGTDLRLVSYSSSTGLEGTNLVVTGLARTEKPLVQPRVIADARGKKGSSVESVAEPKREPEPLTDVVRYIRFRYWDGSQWLSTWNDVELPSGVEISLGTEPMTSESGEYAGELFRRVVYVPGNGVSDGGWSNWDIPDSTSTNKAPGETL